MQCFNRNKETAMSVQGKPITIKLPENLSSDAASNLRAYLVNGAGKLIETAGFEGGFAKMRAADPTVKSPRYFIAPSFPESYPPAKIDAFALAQIGAYQLSPSFGSKNEILVQNLPSHTLLPLPVHFCNVQGNVTNALSLNGVTQSGPVCKAKVHICSVDWYGRWPIWLRPVVPHAVINQSRGACRSRSKT
jgi:hypothetical protein